MAADAGTAMTLAEGSEVATAVTFLLIALEIALFTAEGAGSHTKITEVRREMYNDSFAPR